MRGQRQFKADAKRSARQDGCDWLAAFIGFCIHTGALYFAENLMNGLDPLKDAFRGIIAGRVSKVCKNIQIHTRGKILFATG